MEEVCSTGAAAEAASDDHQGQIVRGNVLVHVNSPLVFVHPKLAAKLEKQRLAIKPPRAAKTTKPPQGVDIEESAKPKKVKRKVEAAQSGGAAVSSSGESSMVEHRPNLFRQAVEELRVAGAQRASTYVDWSLPEFAEKTLFELCLMIANGEDPMSRSWSSVFSSSLEELRHSCAMVQMTTYYPRKHHVFEAFRLCPLDNVRVVIMGQDPYPQLSPICGRPYACGLSFSVSENELTVPKSLQTILHEMRLSSTDPNFSDSFYGVPYYDKTEAEVCSPLPEIVRGDLRHWCDQGVLLLNASLTVAPQSPDTHRVVWTGFIVSVLRAIVARNPDVIFCFWGARALSLSEYISSSITQFACGHPSPKARRLDDSEPTTSSSLETVFSADTPFLGSRHMSRVNHTLLRKGLRPIFWHRPWSSGSFAELPTE